MISLTEKAAKKILSIMKEQKVSNDTVVRVGVKGGGCSGFSYKIDFSEIKEKDNVSDYGKFKVLIDPKSSIYLKDVVLDFKDGLNGKGFVFTNPNATNTCGCGESFSV